MPLISELAVAFKNTSINFIQSDVSEHGGEMALTVVVQRQACHGAMSGGFNKWHAKGANCCSCAVDKQWGNCLYMRCIG